jgi:putative transposase
MANWTAPVALSDAEWALVAPLLPPPQRVGRPRTHPRRALLDAIFYLVRTGCQWRLLPQEYPPWRTVYHYWRVWRLDGTWARLHAALRERVRVQAGRDAQPGAGALDSQSVKMAGVGGVRGYDGFKKVRGRKRHLLVDTQGLVLRAWVSPADLGDRAAVPPLLAGAASEFPRLQHVWLDRGYTGSATAWIARELGWTTAVTGVTPRRSVWTDWPGPLPVDWLTRGPTGTLGAAGPPRSRWVVERTFAWLGQSRRLARDYERLPATSEITIAAAMSRLMLRRLARLTPLTPPPHHDPAT